VKADHAEGLIIDSTLTWKDHVNQLAIKLSLVGYAIRTLSLFMSQESLRMIYYDYVHSIMSYGIIIYGSSTHSNIIFKIQKRLLRIIMKARNNDSCHLLFRLLNILPLYSQYIFSILIFVVKNLNLFNLNSGINSIYTRRSLDLHPATYKLARVHRGVSYSGIGYSVTYHRTLRTCHTMLINLNML
jgi:hypothetical protein